jgi:hypothetical protein
VPHAGLATSEGKTLEWKNATIPAYQRRTNQVEALIAGTLIVGTGLARRHARRVPDHPARKIDQFLPWNRKARPLSAAG